MSCPSAKDFRRLVNMSPAEIRAWHKNPNSKLASFASTRSRLPKLAALKTKPISKWTAADCKFAKRVVAFNKRMDGMRKQHGCTVKIDVALRNWGRRACSRQLGMVAPAPPKGYERGKGKGKSVPLPSGIDPWSESSHKKRLATWFFDIRRKQVRDIIPRGMELPAHVKPFAEYMVEESSKPLSNRDIVKAYVLTVGSMQRNEIGSDKLREYWPGWRGQGKIRPEDALAELLQTPAGQRYINAAAAGKIDKQAADTLARNFWGFGKGDQFRSQLNTAVKLAQRSDVLRNKLRHGKRAEWYRFVKEDVPGISVAKSGFFAALLGRGDIATADTRQINFWTCPKGDWNIKTRSCRWPAIEKKKGGVVITPGQFESDAFVDANYLERLNHAMRALKIKMPARYQPFYEHLAHHTFWDALSRSKTTHQSMIDAMRKL